MPLPKGFSWEQGAAICETWITAYLELMLLGELQQGQTILIHAGTLHAFPVNMSNWRIKLGTKPAGQGASLPDLTSRAVAIAMGQESRQS